MDLVTTAIIAAITAGGVSGAGGVGKQHIVDVYTSLKILLSRKFGAQSKEVQAIANLEVEPELDLNKQMLQYRLATAKANEDPELTAAAEELLSLLKTWPQGAQLVIATQSAIGNYIAQAASGSTASVNVNIPKR